MTPLTPREIVAELDKHIIGQAEAKRAVAVALRNRWRWRQLPDDVRREIMPKNILMIGPTGVGKTEITRRLADLTGAPFIKVEATKYTEVGYYGRDVESMVRDLVEKALVLVRRRKQAEIEDEVNRRVEERLLDLLVRGRDDRGEESHAAEVSEKTREALRRMLVDGKLEDREVEMTVEQRQFPVQVFSAVGMEQMDVDLQNIFERIVPRERARRRVKVSEARRILFEQESEAMLDQDLIREEAVRLAEDSGIIFIDEIDKICGPEETGRSAVVSRQGVQRDLLPIVEGTTVSTRYGSVRTDHMLFIAAGAFHRSRPSDLMPELQGRFPIRVELHDLGREDFLRILTEPASSLTKQYQQLLAVEGVELEFTDDGIAELADVAYRVNQTTQNIGARRLHTILERLLEGVSFDAPELPEKRVVIDADYVRRELGDIVKDEDLSRFIL